MALQLFGFHEHPNDFAVTKIDGALEQCVFLLDFSRPLNKVRWPGVYNKWFGPAVYLSVPVVHQAEKSGGYVIGVRRGSPYFGNLQKLWTKHSGSKRTLAVSPIGGLELVADFATHFSEDCQ